MPKVNPFASYRGRISRSTYWRYIWPFMALSLVTSCCDAAMIQRPGIGPAGLLLSLLVAIPAWRLLVKRCHDRNRSGVFIYLLGMVPIIGGPWLFIELGLLKGTSGPNRFGPDPTVPAAATTA